MIFVAFDTVKCYNLSPNVISFPQKVMAHPQEVSIEMLLPPLPRVPLAESEESAN